MQKGTVTPFLLIVGLLIIGLVSIFSFGLIKSPVPQLQKLQTSVLTPSPKFLTYSNQNLGFEFQYSGKDFVVKEDSEEAYNKRGNGDFRKNFKGYVGYEPGKPLGAVVVLDKDLSFDKNPFAVWVFDNPDNLTENIWFDKYWYYPFLWGVFDYTSKGHIALDKEATVSGKTAKYKVVSYQPGAPKFIYVSKNQKMYLFRIIGEAGDKILSSFKFLDQNETSAEGRFCGGIAGNLPENQCPVGYRCQLDGKYPDAGGKCVKL